jgi:hypothetical protein
MNDKFFGTRKREMKVPFTQRALRTASSSKILYGRHTTHHRITTKEINLPLWITGYNIL